MKDIGRERGETSGSRSALAEQAGGGGAIAAMSDWRVTIRVRHVSTSSGIQMRLCSHNTQLSLLSTTEYLAAACRHRDAQRGGSIWVVKGMCVFDWRGGGVKR